MKSQLKARRLDRRKIPNAPSKKSSRPIGLRNGKRELYVTQYGESETFKDINKKAVNSRTPFGYTKEEQGWLPIIKGRKTAQTEDKAIRRKQVTKIREAKSFIGQSTVNCTGNLTTIIEKYKPKKRINEVNNSKLDSLFKQREEQQYKSKEVNKIAVNTLEKDDKEVRTESNEHDVTENKEFDEMDKKEDSSSMCESESMESLSERKSVVNDIVNNVIELSSQNIERTNGESHIIVAATEPETHKQKSEGSVIDEMKDSDGVETQTPIECNRDVTTETSDINTQNEEKGVEEKKNANEADRIELLRVKENDGLKHCMWPITPTNLEEERQKFFKFNCKRNPQFTYCRPKMAARLLRSFKKPDGTLLPLAIKIMEAFLKKYGSQSNYLSTDAGEALTLTEAKEIFREYINGLNLTSYLRLDFSYNTVSPTTISHGPRNNQSVITIGLPINYRKKRIEGVLNHEIGTHFLRNYNDQFQVWCKARGKYHLKNYLNTEEGLASLNQLYDTVSGISKHRL